MSWNNVKVLVGGGAGMIGSHLSNALVTRGAIVTIVDDLSSGSIKNIQDFHKDVEFIKKDLRDFSTCIKLAKGKEVVFQLACNMGGIGYIMGPSTYHMIDSNLININMLRAAHKQDVGNYFFSSSACVYPNYKQTTESVPGLKEEDVAPADPNEFYGWEKLFCEKIVESFQKDYADNIHVARFHNIYGAAYTAFDEAKAKAPCKMILGALRNEIEIWNDGKQTRSFLYIDDCIEAILRLMGSNFTKPINIGSERLISMNDLAALVIAASNKQVPKVYCPEKPQGVRGRNSDNTLIRRVLGWEPSVPLEVGLRTVYRWAEIHYNELEGV